MKHTDEKTTTVEELKTPPPSEIWASIQTKPKPFQTFHQHIYQKTGVWIEELVPIFQQLDDQLKK